MWISLPASFPWLHHHTPISKLSEDILSSVFDWLDLGQLVIASHVCRRWRLLAFEHQTFWRQATISRSLDSTSEVDFFLARLSRSQVGQRPIDITIEPNRNLPSPPRWTPHNVWTMQHRIIPVICAALSCVTAITLDIPADLSEPMFDALRQPAPALRRFTIANRSRQGSMLLPLDMFASDAPALVELVVRGDIRLPTQPVPAFHRVQTLELPEGRQTLRVSDIFAGFPSAHHINARLCRSATVGSLNPQQLQRLGRLDSLGLNNSLLGAMRQSGVAYKHISTIRRLDLKWFEWPTVPQRFQAVADPGAPHVLMPQSSQELHCWLQVNHMRLVFASESGSVLRFVRTVQWEMANTERWRIWVEVCAYSALVTLAVDIDVLSTLRDHAPPFPALEALLVTLGSQLPWYVGLHRPASCPRLRTVLFQNQLYGDKPQHRAVVTCRGTDDFLRALFAVGDWTALDVVLTDVILYGNAKVAGTRISGVRTLSKKECARLGPRVAILLEDADM